MEFRCFVRDRRLLCISQRGTHYYDFLHDLKDDILKLGMQLFEQIKDFESDNWVFDMYIPRTRIRAHLIDINPFAPRTDPALYSWEEVLGMRGEVDVRFVKQDHSGISGIEFSAQRVPIEVVRASQGRGVVEFAVEWEEMLRQGVQDHGHDSDEE